MSFSTDEVLTLEKLDQMQSNLTWIWENTPSTKYIYDSGQFKTSESLILSGKAKGDFRTSRPSPGNISYISSLYVSFSQNFNISCIPNITMGLLDIGQWGGITISYSSADANGFAINVTSSNPDSLGPWQIYWQAVGFI